MVEQNSEQKMRIIMRINIILRIKVMLRVNSEVFRNNTHSLNKKQTPYSLQNSKADSCAKNRKMSMASLKQNIPDLEKLIFDIKISPNGKKGSDEENIKKIMASLKELERNHSVREEVSHIKYLMGCVEKKIKGESIDDKQAFQKRKSIDDTDAKLNQISPIKQISDDTSSRILYTNFSLKDIEKTSKSSSIQNSCEKNAPKITVSKFEEVECFNNSEVDRLNDQIKYLEELLHRKTSGSEGLFKKKSNKY